MEYLTNIFNNLPSIINNPKELAEIWRISVCMDSNVSHRNMHSSTYTEIYELHIPSLGVSMNNNIDGNRFHFLTDYEYRYKKKDYLINETDKQPRLIKKIILDKSFYEQIKNIVETEKKIKHSKKNLEGIVKKLLIV